MLLIINEKNNINKTKSTSEEFWQILEYNDKIVFRSFQNIYVYQNDTITRISPSSTVISCSIVNDILYVSTLNEGVFILNKQLQLTPILKNEIIKGDRIISISKYKTPTTTKIQKLATRARTSSYRTLHCSWLPYASLSYTHEN